MLLHEMFVEIINVALMVVCGLCIPVVLHLAMMETHRTRISVRQKRKRKEKQS